MCFDPFKFRGLPFTRFTKNFHPPWGHSWSLFRIPFLKFQCFFFLFWYKILFYFISPAISLAVILVWIGPFFSTSSSSSSSRFLILLFSVLLSIYTAEQRERNNKQRCPIVFGLEDGTSSRDCFVIDSLLCFPRSFRLIIHRATSWNTDRYTFSCSGFRIFFSFLFGLSLSIWFGWNSLEKISFHQISE